jgi:RNA polymerase sigma-70 factor, ECF subfamily
MPPIPAWFRGVGGVGDFLAARVRSGSWRALLTAANTQPAVALYRRDGDEWRYESLHVLDVRGGSLGGLVVFRDPHVVTGFGLPGTLAADRHLLEVGDA